MGKRSRHIPSNGETIKQSGYRLGRGFHAIFVHGSNDLRDVFKGRVRYASDDSNRASRSDGRGELHDESSDEGFEE